ncbi:MAG TPA: glycosyltransferase family 4 protein [Rubrivivax sp.]|nr:glycosyltransferase family 4 protein [Rubrivivax sp.]
MNMLLVNHYAGSPALGMEFRPYYLAREWVRQGHGVQVLAADFSHVRARQPSCARPAGAPRWLAGDEVIDGIAYRWMATPRYRGNGLGRVRNIWAFLRAVWADTPRLVSEFRPDVVIASSTYPMDIWVARRLARQAGAKLVYEVHDLWPLSPIELSGMSRRHPFIMLVQAAEDAAYRDADVVVSMLPKVHDYMASRGLDLRKLHIVPNGIALDDWQQAPPPLRADVAQALAAARELGRTVVGYAGSMGLPNALDALLDAAALLRGVALQFILVGDGHEKARLVRRVAEEELDNVTLLAPVPKAQIPTLLAAIDIAYIGWQQVPIYRFGIAPNKLMDYMMAGVPVLHSVDAGNDPVAEAGCGLTVAPEAPAAVAAGLRQLAALSLEERREMGRRGREFVRAHHSYAVLARRFIEALG